MFSDYAWPTIVLAVIALLSLGGDWLTRNRRKGIFGLIPWPLITILAIIATAYFGAAWLRD